MVNKGWTREQVGKLTLMDLRVVTHEKAPPEPFSAEPIPIRSPEELTRALQQREIEKNSWLQ